MTSRCAALRRQTPHSPQQLPPAGDRSKQAAPHGISKRDALLATGGLVAALAPPAGAIPFFGGGDTKPRALLPPSNKVADETLAYEFTYPVKTASGREIPVVTSRRPEKYSSAAPLTADARQRIVTELVSLLDGVTYTVYVGPATGKLRDAPPESWTAPQVATVVLTDRSAVRAPCTLRVLARRVPQCTAPLQSLALSGGVCACSRATRWGSACLSPPSRTREC